MKHFNTKQTFLRVHIAIICSAHCCIAALLSQDTLGRGQPFEGLYRGLVFIMWFVVCLGSPHTHAVFPVRPLVRGRAE